MQYRIIPAINDEYTLFVKPEYKVYMCLVSRDGLLWQPLAPAKGSLFNTSWFKPNLQYDKNVLNEKAGLPPNYYVINPAETTLEKEILKYFPKAQFISKTLNECVFEDATYISK